MFQCTKSTWRIEINHKHTEDLSQHKRQSFKKNIFLICHFINSDLLPCIWYIWHICSNMKHIINTDCKASMQWCVLFLWVMWRTGASCTALQRGKLPASLFLPPPLSSDCQQSWHICTCPARLVPPTAPVVFLNRPNASGEEGWTQCGTTCTACWILFKTLKDSLYLETAFIFCLLCENNRYWYFLTQDCTILTFFCQ